MYPLRELPPLALTLAALKKGCTGLVFDNLSERQRVAFEEEFNSVMATLKEGSNAGGGKDPGTLLQLVGSKFEPHEHNVIIRLFRRTACWFSSLFGSKREPVVCDVRIAIQPKPAPQIDAGPGTGSRPEAKNFSNIPSAVEGV